MTLLGLMAAAGWAGIAILLLFWRSFIPEYLKEKGKNLATHEDINKIVDQMTAVTQATKRIEANISDAVWDRQKRWELRREVLFDTTKAIAAMVNKLATFHSLVQTD